MRVLIVVTSRERSGTRRSGNGRTGTRLESFVAGYYTLVDAGLDVAVCSPLGGPAPVLPHDRGRYWPELMSRFHADSSAREDLSDTLTLSQVCPADFSGMYYPDSPGAAWDLVDDADSKALIAQQLQLGQPCGFVGYANAALLRVRDTEGRAMVTGRRIATSTQDSGATRLVSLGREFARLGAELVETTGSIRMVRDRNLITATDTASSVDVARAIAKATPGKE